MGKTFACMQVQTVIMVSPGGCNLVRFLNDFVGNTAFLQAGSNSESRKTGTNDECILVQRRLRKWVPILTLGSICNPHPDP